MIEKELREFGFRPIKFKRDIDDDLKEVAKREIVKRIIVGDLFFCTKCYNVHRPGAHRNLGINCSDFADIIRMCRDSAISEKAVAKKFAKLIAQINYSGIVDDNGLIKPVLIEPSISSAHIPIGGGGFCDGCYNVHSCGDCDIQNENKFSLSEYATSNKEDLRDRYGHINPDVLNYAFLTQAEHICIFQMENRQIDGIYTCPSGHYHHLTDPPCERFNEDYRQWRNSALLREYLFFELVPGIEPNHK